MKKYLTILFLLFFTYTSHATDTITASTAKNSEEIEEVCKTHTLTTAKTSIEYESIIFPFILKNGEGKERATLVCTAYIAKRPKAPRPILFCFNGGPGSSSVWLHMGLLGPKKISLSDPLNPKIPATYEQNPYSLLQTCDLIFIDPTSTGFSRGKKEELSSLYSTEGDIQSVSDCIVYCLNKFNLWDRKKYLVGESYGTIRAVGTADYLIDTHHVDLNGIVLVSPCLNFQAYDTTAKNDLGYITYLPSYTISAYYWKKLNSVLMQKDIQTLSSEVEEFCLHEYSRALFLGNRLSKENKEQIAEKIATYTGLSKEFILLNNLRIQPANFYVELLRKEQMTIGRFDSRFAVESYIGTSEYNTTDPSYYALAGRFHNVLESYIRTDLEWKKSDRYYRILTDVFPWNFQYKSFVAGGGYLNTAITLEKLLEKNSHFHVFIACGYFDLATPYFASRYVLSQLTIPESAQQKITEKLYSAGHMMYIEPNILKQLSIDLEEFIQKR